MNEIIGLWTTCPVCRNTIYVSFRNYPLLDGVIRNGHDFTEICGKCGRRIYIEIKIKTGVEE